MGFTTETPSVPLLLYLCLRPALSE